MPPRRALALSALLLVSSLSSARAQDDAPEQEPSASEVAAAREAFVEGAKAARDDRWEQAYEAFRRSYALYPQPSTLLNLAGARAQTGRLVEAAEGYRSFVREAGPREQAHLEAARDALESVEQRIPRLRVFTTERADELRVELDGRVLPPEALGTELPVNPGEHRLELTREGALLADRSVTLEERETVDVRLRPDPARDADTAAEPGEPTGDGGKPDSPLATEPRNDGPAAAVEHPARPPRWNARPPAAQPGDGSECASAQCGEEGGRLELFALEAAAGLVVDGASQADAVEGGMGGLGMHFRVLRYGDRQPFGMAAVLGVATHLGRWRGLLAAMVAVDIGATVRLGWPRGATLTVLYTPAFVHAEGLDHFAYRAYRVRAGVQLWAWNLGLSYQELGRGADSTLRPLLLDVEVAF